VKQVVQCYVEITELAKWLLPDECGCAKGIPMRMENESDAIKVLQPGEGQSLLALGANMTFLQHQDYEGGF
jgi:hypothetical protein